MREEEVENVLTAAPPLLPACLSVCLPRCVCGTCWAQLGAVPAQRLPGPPVAGGQLRDHQLADVQWDPEGGLPLPHQAGR